MKKPVKIAIIDTGLTERYISADTKIARAILQNKNILLLDEPTSGLDAINAEKVMDCIEKYSKSKVTLLITHDKIAEKRCGQVFHLVDGALV